MAALIAIGIVLIFAAGALYVARDAVIARVTSRPLGSLPPGYAATKLGYRVYAGLVADIGLIALGAGLNIAWLVIVAVMLFVIETIVVIAGEVVTYRNLKGPRRSP